MTFQTIIARKDDGIGIITLNRPNVLNAIDSNLNQEVTEAVADFTNDADIAVIVVHGAGRAFSSGFDMKEAAARGPSPPSEIARIREEDFRFIMQFWECPKPTIAAVHGYCLAGAFELALACDLTIAASDAMFGEPEVRFGSAIVCQLLPWITSAKIAKELLLTGRMNLGARRAYELGIVNEVVAEGAALDRALEIARMLQATARESLRLTKRSINRTYEIAGLQEALKAALDTALTIESDIGPERVEFNRIRSAQGLKAALAWRDARFRKGVPE
jgi:enoyl-CoA hydratase